MAALTSGGRYLRASRLRSRPYEDRFFLQRRDAGVALVRRRGSFPQRDGVVFSLNRRRRRIPPSAAVAAQRFRARRKPGPTGKRFRSVAVRRRAEERRLRGVFDSRGAVVLERQFRDRREARVVEDRRVAASARAPDQIQQRPARGVASPRFVRRGGAPPERVLERARDRDVVRRAVAPARGPDPRSRRNLEPFVPRERASRTRDRFPALDGARRAPCARARRPSGCERRKARAPRRRLRIRSGRRRAPSRRRRRRPRRRAASAARASVQEAPSTAPRITRRRRGE